ncbi:hypothetical protein HID58_049486 [Brassica napus]|uniref:Uncharacterized protein n=1 Tax=Brassica napus TaxID=3708 RepID=A0ABQ8B645_BRANA|nr:hypothetical protein HID58_049486 [Brassica napus]
MTEQPSSRVTKHFSDEFSQFCDRKMSDFVWMLCWNRVSGLNRFYCVGASKSVWLVHLLANSVNSEKDYWFDLQLVVTGLRIWFGLWFNQAFMCTVVWLSAR